MTPHYLISPTIADVLHADGEAIVLSGETLFRLSSLAAEILRHCAEPRTIRELVSHCLSILGPAPEGTADTAIGDAVNQLLSSHVLISKESA